MSWNIFNRLMDTVDWTFDRKQTVATPQSTCLDYVEYTPRSHRMMCGFTDGSEYAYSGVEKEAYLDLIGAGSVGRHFNYNVRMQYPYQRTF
jgi:hypothetical protein